MSIDMRDFCKALFVIVATSTMLACGPARDDVTEVKKTEQAAQQTTMTMVHEPAAIDVTGTEQALEAQPTSMMKQDDLAMSVVVQPEPVDTTPDRPEVVPDEVMGSGLVEKPVESVPGVTKEVAPGSDRVFVVSTMPKDPSHTFYNKGHKVGFALNGVQNLEPVLERGEKYTFKVDTGVQHDFYLSTSPVGWGAATYSDGVTGNYTYKGIVTFTPTSATPSIVYYQCRNHKNMGGRLHIVDKGEKAIITSIESETKRPAAAVTQPGMKVDINQIQQKINFAKMFIVSSAAEKRIMSSQNSEAKGKFEQAKNQLASSQEALANEDYEAAMNSVNEAMKSMTAASKLVPTESQKEKEKARFSELLESVQHFEDSYERNYNRMVKKKGASSLTRLDLDAVHDKVERAKAMANDNDYAQANKLLQSAQQTITSELTKMLDSETVSYELVFETPAEEYEYELSRYKSFEELIPIAIEQKRPPQQSIDLMYSIVEKAREIYEMSGPEAEKENYTTAIQMLQGATSRLQKALRVVGVR